MITFLINTRSLSKFNFNVENVVQSKTKGMFIEKMVHVEFDAYDSLARALVKECQKGKHITIKDDEFGMEDQFLIISYDLAIIGEVEEIRVHFQCLKVVDAYQK